MKRYFQMAIVLFVFSLLMGGFRVSYADPVSITSWAELDNVRNTLDGSFILMNDLDELTPGYADFNTVDGWTPIGTPQESFTGTFDGNGFVIRGLMIDVPTSDNGLFGVTRDAIIKDLGLLDVDITTLGWRTGALIGDAYNTMVKDCHSTGIIKDVNELAESAHFGGLIGRINAGVVLKSWSSVDIESTGWMVGGLIGTMTGAEPLAELSYATGNVSGNRWVGGFSGQIGGVATIRDSYATGNVTGTDQVNPTRVGGLVGQFWRNSVLERTYSTGEVAGVTDTGGLVGNRDELGEEVAYVINSFWDTESSGTEIGVGAGDTEGMEGKTTAEMKTEATFTDAAWNFTKIWDMDENVNEGYPFIREDAEPTSIEMETNVPNAMVLNQNYPNPFNPVTNIRYELIESSDVTLTVYNVMGQSVATLVDTRQNAGSHTAAFDASGFSSGVYIYQLRAGNQVLTRQMTLVK